MKEIPIAAAKRIAEEYGYDQVVILARKCGTEEGNNGEHLTTYGVNKEHCKIASAMGDFLKFKVMGWQKQRG